MQRFIALRDRSGNWKRPNVALFSMAEPTRDNMSADPYIDVVEHRADKLDQLALDETFLSITPVMATRLIAPEPLDGHRPEEAEPGWGLRAIGADRTRFTGAGTKIALLDTGIDQSHPAFDGLNIETHDFVGTGAEDANGHGTHLAGTVFGRDLGGTRIGVARGVNEVLIGKTVSDRGLGQSDSLAKALLWAAQEQADIVGFALRFDVLSEMNALVERGFPERLAHAAATSAFRGNLRMIETLLMMMAHSDLGLPLVIAAVGNDCLRSITPEVITGPTSPAAARGILTIGALGQDEGTFAPSHFSNAGPNFTAPGENILSAAPNNETRISNGSSMAMAHAVGTAALWVEKMRGDGTGITPQTLAESLLSTATTANMAPDSNLFTHGCGMVQAPLPTL